MALENRFSVISKKEAYETAKVYYEILSKLYTSNTYKNRQAFYDMEKAYNDLVNAEADAVLAVKKAYVDMVKAGRSIEALGKSREALAEAYRLTLLSYELGMGTLVDVLGAESALKEMEIAELEAIHGYNLAKLNFEHSYGIGMPQ